MVAKVVDFLRFSGAVKRYHTWPVLRADTVGEHTWNVLRIYVELFGPPAPEVTVYVIHHDSPEVYTGDPPFPIKRDNPDVKAGYDRMEREFEERHGLSGGELSPDDRIRVKVCDLIDMWEFGMVEMAMGNTLAENIVLRTSENVERLSQGLSERERDKVRNYLHSTREKLR